MQVPHRVELWPQTDAEPVLRAEGVTGRFFTWGSSAGNTWVRLT